MPLLYSFGKLTLGKILMAGWQPHVEGIEHVPAAGGAIFASNHLSVSDELFLAAVVDRHLAFWAKSDYFTGTGVKGIFFRQLMAGVGAIRVERAGGRAALTAFDAAIPALRAGDLVAVYPEGTRSPDGRLYRGRTGVARLAVAAGVPIIPVGVTGTEKVQPIGQLYPSPMRGVISIRIGKPIETTGRSDDRHTLRELTDQVMTDIQRLTGQEYIPRYAPKRPDQT